MTPAARVAAAIAVLDRILGGEPAERALTNWARGSRFAGSGDRAAVRDLVFDVLRRRRSCAAPGGGETGRALLLGLLRGQGTDPAGLFTGEGHAPAPLSAEEAEGQAEGELADAVRLDLPDWLMPELRRSLGADLDAVAELLRTRAPVGLRVNLARAGHAEADAALLEDGIVSEPHPLAASARVVTGNARRIGGARAYREGLVELQDPASQAVAEALLPVAPGARILDFCAGGGGKALALAGATGLPVAAHDADPRRMRDLPARAARAGAEIACLSAAEVRAGAPWDLVLADAPCSGSGAWRRQPEAKWTLSPARLEALGAVQGEILEAASQLVAPGGRLAYATCSLLEAENGDPVRAFLARGGGRWRCLSERRISPLEGADGFFVSILARE